MAFDEYGDYYDDGSGNSYTSGDSSGFDWSSLSDMFGSNDYAPDYSGSYENNYYDLASQLAEQGVIPYNDMGMPEIDYLMNSQFGGAVDSGSLGNVSDYGSLVVPTDLGQQEYMDAQLKGQGLDAVVGGSGSYIDDQGRLISTDELVNGLTSSMQSAQGFDPSKQYAQLSAVDGLSGVGNLAPQSAYSGEGLALAPQNDYVKDATSFMLSNPAEQGYTREPEVAPATKQDPWGLGPVYKEGTQAYDEMLWKAAGLNPEVFGPKSYYDAASFGAYVPEELRNPESDYFTNPGAYGSGEDQRSVFQKVVGGLSQLLGGGKSTAQGAASGNRTTQGGNGQQGSTAGGAKSLAEMLALAAGAFQGPRKAPAASGDNRGADAWRVSRKAGSGRQNKADGGLIENMTPEQYGSLMEMVRDPGTGPAFDGWDRYGQPMRTDQAMRRNWEKAMNANSNIGSHYSKKDELEFIRAMANMGNSAMTKAMGSAQGMPRQHLKFHPELREAPKKAAGGLLQMAKGGRATGGQDDVVPINAAQGEYVFDADTVASLGDGNTAAGAAKLDEMRYNIRKHKRAAPANKIPPKAKSPLEYMKGSK